jgi:hypothetical protein
MEKNFRWISSVIGPRLPLPIGFHHPHQPVDPMARSKL